MCPATLWVTPNSAGVAHGKNAAGFLLSTEKNALENVENAYNLANSSEEKTVFWVTGDSWDSLKCQVILGLKPSTTYYYVALVYDSVGEYFSYGDISSFTTDEPISEIVDLGLSVKWRGYNLGASSPYDRGDGYMWGYTSSGHDNFPTYPKETNIVGTGYDAAKVNLGNDWRMPTISECEELSKKCSFQKVVCTSPNNVVRWEEGIYVTGPSGKHLFIPETWSLLIRDQQYFESFDTCCFWIGESHGDQRAYFYGYRREFGKVTFTSLNWKLPIRAVTE